MHKKPQPETSIERIATRATAWVGSPTSLVVHTILFVTTFLLMAFGAPRDTVLLVLTTIVSLEAIYLSIFIQMSVNRSSTQLAEVSEDIEVVMSEVEEIGEDIDEIQKDVEEIERDVDEIQSDVEEMQEDVEGIEKEVTALSDEVEEISEDIEKDEAEERIRDQEMLTRVESSLSALMQEIQNLKDAQKKKPASVKKQTLKK